MKNILKNSKLAIVLLLTGALAACSTPATDPNLAKDQTLNGADNAGNNGGDPNFTNTQNKDLGDSSQYEKKQYHGYSQKDLQTVNNTVYFEFDSYVPANQFREVIQAHADMIIKTNAKVLLEGYTDERGTPEYNITLGSERNRSVYKMLVGFGVDPKQIRQLSFGEEKPAVLGHTEREYSQNRRVKFNYNF